MRILLTPTLALALATGAQAQNDECANATVVTLGTFLFDTTGATTSAPTWPCAGGGSDLWYAYTATSNDRIVLSLCGSSYDTALEAFSGPCGSLVSLACDDDACDLASAIAFAGTLGTTYRFRIGGFGGDTGAGTCTVALFPPLGAEDECVGALPLASGSTPYTNVGATDSAPSWPCAAGGSDVWYTFTAAGNAVDIDTFGSDYDTALQAFSGTCASLVSIGCNDDAGVTLQSMLSLPTNPGQTFYVRVGGFFGDQGIGVLNVVGAGAPPGGSIGTNYCSPAIANSTGAPGAIAASGSAVVAANDVTLEASDLPSNSFGYFLTSRTQGSIQNPGGSQGRLCLGGQIGRYVGPGQVMSSGALGEFSLSVDLSQTPTSLGLTAIAVGDTWNFQAWHRDSLGGSATSNFTNGLSILFL